MPPSSAEAKRHRFLERTRLGILCSSRKDGRPLAVPVCSTFRASVDSDPQPGALASKPRGRGGRIRTGDFLLPRQARYQAALRPDRSGGRG